MTMDRAWQKRRLKVHGMDCAECALHTEEAVRSLQGVREARVYLGAERLDVVYDPDLTDTDQIAKAVEHAGYRIADESEGAGEGRRPDLAEQLTGLFVAAVVLVILVVTIGERLGILEAALARVPPWLPIAAVLVGGYPIFRNVVLALRQRQVTAHALMTLGIIGALSIGEYAAAVVIVFFMRVSDYLEGLTTDRSRQAIRALMRLAPETAHRLRDPDGDEEDIAVEEVSVEAHRAVHQGDGTERLIEYVDDAPPIW